MLQLRTMATIVCGAIVWMMFKSWPCFADNFKWLLQLRLGMRMWTYVQSERSKGRVSLKIMNNKPEYVTYFYYLFACPHDQWGSLACNVELTSHQNAFLCKCVFSRSVSEVCRSGLHFCQMTYTSNSHTITCTYVTSSCRFWRVSKIKSLSIQSLFRYRRVWICRNMIVRELLR